MEYSVSTMAFLLTLAHVQTFEKLDAREGGLFFFHFVLSLQISLVSATLWVPVHAEWGPMLTYYIAAFRNGQQEFWDNNNTHSLWESLLEKKIRSYLLVCKILLRETMSILKCATQLFWLGLLRTLTAAKWVQLCQKKREEPGPGVLTRSLYHLYTSEMVAGLIALTLHETKWVYRD